MIGRGEDPATFGVIDLRCTTAEQLRLGGALVRAGLVTAAQLRVAKRHSAETGGTVAGALIHIGAIRQRDLMAFALEWED